MLFKVKSFNVTSLSIDDFYLPYQSLKELGEKHSSNPILQVRGNAGTHDVKLGASILEQCISLKEGESLATPLYDKSQHEGKGDRAAESSWPVVQGPLDLILFEGWMLGFQPCFLNNINQVRN